MNTQEYLQYLLNKEEWTPEEKKWMQQYLETNDLSALEAVALQAYNDDQQADDALPGKKMAETVLDRIHQQIGVAPVTPSRKITWFGWKFTVAASLLLIAGTGYLFRDMITGLFKQVPMMEVATAAGERRQLILPDSSVVTLEPGSSIHYPEHFEKEAREVTLVGEAFFNVQKDAAHPFVIHTQFVNTTVLGTSFAVEAYPVKQTKVIVVTGRVRVQPVKKEHAAGELVITANQSAVYNTSTGEMEKSEAAADALFYGQRFKGEFDYKGVRIEQVLKDMERFYQVPVQAKGKIRDCSFYGSFYTTDELTKALALVAESLNAKIVKDSLSGVYQITGGICP